MLRIAVYEQGRRLVDVRPDLFEARAPDQAHGFPLSAERIYERPLDGSTPHNERRIECKDELQVVRRVLAPVVVVVPALTLAYVYIRLMYTCTFAAYLNNAFI